MTTVAVTGLTGTALGRDRTHTTGAHSARAGTQGFRLAENRETAPQVR